MTPKTIQIILCTIILAALSGCSSISYYSQSIVGHSRLMLAREPIDEVIATAPPELKKTLSLAKSIRRFAIDELGLPDNQSYLSYVDLQREFPVWTVVAAGEFSLQAKQWCYPVIGCAMYRGYFSDLVAQRYADSLTKQGLETTVAGASAYSTLGWFADPLLPSMLRNGESGLAETIFHELAHQVIYENGDSAFNEAFASVVGEQGALLWLQRNRLESVGSYRDRLLMRADFYQLLKSTKASLQSLYQSGLNTEQKHHAKQTIFSELDGAYQQLKSERWQGRTDYDAWFEQPLNNAHLAAVSTYREQMPALLHLLSACGNDFRRYYERLKSTSPKMVMAELDQSCEQAG